MSLEAKIEKLTEAVEALAAGLQGALDLIALQGGAAPQKAKPAPAAAEFAGAGKTAQTKPARGVVEEVKKQEPPKQEPTDGAEESKYAAALGLTYDDIRAKMLPIVKEHGADFMNAALGVLGAKALSELEPAQYPALLEAAEKALGQEISI